MVNSGIEVRKYGAYNLHTNYSDSVFQYLVDEVFTQETYKFYSKKAQPLIIDIGANIGLTTIYFKELYPKSKIYALEPEPTNFELLTKNVKETDAKLFQMAASNANGKLPFYTSSKEDNNLPVSSFYKNEFSNLEIEVAVIDFSEMVNSLEVVDLCKIDVEGEESNIVDSLLKGSCLNSVNEFIIEYHPWVDQLFSLKQMVEIFESNGFGSTMLKQEEKNTGITITGTTILKFQQSGL